MISQPLIEKQERERERVLNNKKGTCDFLWKKFSHERIQVIIPIKRIYSPATLSPIPPNIKFVSLHPPKDKQPPMEEHGEELFIPKSL